MRALVYNGALAVYGGGERYTFALADVLSERCEVMLATEQLPDVQELARRGFPTNYEIRSLRREGFTKATRGFDLVIQNRFSPPTQSSHADRTVAVVQFPGSGLAPISRPKAFLRQRHAMRTFDGYITYSEFCAQFVSSRWQVHPEVVYPPASLGQNHEHKEPGILAISRFEPTKKHAALIAAHQALPPALRRQHPLHLVGGCGHDESSQAYLERLRRSAAGQNIFFHPNATQAHLDDLLRRTTLFWHAKGYGRPSDRPDLAEHFGIVAVEAMSHGLVPLVVDDGGLPEVVDASCGVLWRSVDELVSATCGLLQDEDHRAELAERAVARSKGFGRAAFDARVRALLL